MNPRVAFFTDCFHEVNGVALTSRQFEAFAERNRLPFLRVSPGPATTISDSGGITRIELRDSLLRIPVDADLGFDLLFLRHLARVQRTLERFRPGLVHVTSPGACGILGALLAYRLGVPLVASWHTNIHEFLQARLERSLQFLPLSWRSAISCAASRRSLQAILYFYGRAGLILAPNAELVDLLSSWTGRPTAWMRRGVDASLFSPSHRSRTSDTLQLGFVGRLTPEKNLRLFADVERALIHSGIRDYRFVIVGEGSEKAWLQKNLRNVECTGVRKGADLARSYANFDVFLFPSHTDTYGNVVNEALASGVPAIVTADGGPKFLVRSGVSGLVAFDDAAFVRLAVELAADRAKRIQMSAEARKAALESSWDRVFSDVYSAYSEHIVRPGDQCSPSFRFAAAEGQS